MTEEPLRATILFWIAWRRRLMVGVFAMLGLLGGIAYSLLRPPATTAVALVLLPPSPLTTSGAPTTSINTQVIIGESAPVLARAARSVTPSVDPRHLKLQLSVTPLSQDVLQFTVRASTPTKADRLANAVAESYIRYVTQSLSGPITVLRRESAHLQRQMRRVQTQISELSSRLALETLPSPTRLQNSAQLASLQSEQQQLTLQLDGVEGQIVSVQSSNGTQAASTRLLQRATNAVPLTRTLRMVELGAMGLAIGLLLAIIVVLFRSRRDHLLRLRSELANAIGVPVMASIGANSCSSAADWCELLDRPRASPATAWNLHRIIHDIPESSGAAPTRIRVLSFVDDAPASTVGALLAVYAASTGAPTAYLAPPEDPFIQFRVAWSARDNEERLGTLAMLESNGKALDLSGTRLLVSTILVDRSDPMIPSVAGTSVLAVSAGDVTRDDLARLALSLAKSGSVLEGLIVVNPVPHDPSSGLLDKAHTPSRSPSFRVTHTAASTSAT